MRSKDAFKAQLKAERNETEAVKQVGTELPETVNVVPPQEARPPASANGDCDGVETSKPKKHQDEDRSARQDRDNGLLQDSYTRPHEIIQTASSEHAALVGGSLRPSSMVHASSKDSNTGDVGTVHQQSSPRDPEAFPPPESLEDTIGQAPDAAVEERHTAMSDLAGDTTKGDVVSKDSATAALEIALKHPGQNVYTAQEILAATTVEPNVEGALLPAADEQAGVTVSTPAIPGDSSTTLYAEPASESSVGDTVAEEEAKRVLSSLSPTRIPTSEPYLSIEAAEAAINMHEQELMKKNKSESNLSKSSAGQPPLPAATLLSPVSTPQASGSMLAKWEGGEVAPQDVIQRICGQCEEERELTHHCEECDGPLCSDCAISHGRLKVFRLHHLRVFETENGGTERIKLNEQSADEFVAASSFNMDFAPLEWQQAFKAEKAQTICTGQPEQAAGQVDTQQHQMGATDQATASASAQESSENDERAMEYSQADPDILQSDGTNASGEPDGRIKESVSGEEAAASTPSADDVAVSSEFLEKAETSQGADDAFAPVARSIAELVDQARRLFVMLPADRREPFRRELACSRAMLPRLIRVLAVQAIQCSYRAHLARTKLRSLSSDGESQVGEEAKRQAPGHSDEGSAVSMAEKSSAAIEEHAAVKVQSRTRGARDDAIARRAQEQKELATLEQKATLIQARVRGVSGRRQASNLKARKDMTASEILPNKIEKLEPALQCQECDEGGEAIEHCVDCSLLMCADCCKHHRKSRRSKDHTMQSIDAYKAREAQEKAAVKIQARARGSRDRSRARVVREAKGQEAGERKRQEEAALKIQARARGSRDRARCGLLRDEQVQRAEAQETQREQAALKIQSRARGARDRGKAGSIREERMRSVAAEAEQQSLAAVKIQARARGARDRIKVEVLKEVKVDTSVAERVQESQAAVKIQARARGVKDRSKVQSLRNELEKRAAEDEKQSHAAKQIQARARGMRARRSMIEIRDRVSLYTVDPADQRPDALLNFTPGKSPQSVRPDPNESDPSVSEGENSGAEGEMRNRTDEQASDVISAPTAPRVSAKTLSSNGPTRIRAAHSALDGAGSKQPSRLPTLPDDGWKSPAGIESGSGVKQLLLCMPEDNSPWVSKGQRLQRPVASKGDGFTRTEYDNGDWYQGNVKRGVRHGSGVYKYANGDRYDGEWVLGQKHGDGTYTWSLGESYCGMWMRGKQNGKGVFEWPGGGRYEGEWGERVPGHPFPRVRPKDMEKKQTRAGSCEPGIKISNDAWRAKEQRVYRSGRPSKATGIAWAAPSRPTTAMSQATTIGATSRPRTADGLPAGLLDEPTPSKAVRVSDQGSARPRSTMQQSSGISQMSSSTLFRKALRDEPDEPARAGQGADDIFMNLAHAMRSNGKMTQLKAKVAKMLVHSEPWQMNTKEASILRQRSTEPSQHSKVHNRLLADINTGKKIDRLVGFEPSLEDFDQLNRADSMDPQAAIQDMLLEMRQNLGVTSEKSGLKEQAVDQAGLSWSGRGQDDVVRGGCLRNESSLESIGSLSTLSSISKSGSTVRCRQSMSFKIPIKKKKTLEGQLYESILLRTEARLRKLLEDQGFADHKMGAPGFEAPDTDLRMLFEKFCVVRGHSEHQTDGRQFTMDKHEWIECLIHLDLLKSSLTKKVDDYILTRQEAVDLFLDLKRKTTKNEDMHELNFRDFKRIIGQLGAVLELKILIMNRISTAELTRRSIKPKHIKPISTSASTASAPEDKEMLSLIRSSRGSIGYGFGMSVALKKMSDNLSFQDPLSLGASLSWQLRSCPPS